MGKTKIEWCTHSVNPVKGLCPIDCKDNQGKPYCYARRMYQRYKWTPEIRYDTPAWKGLMKIPAGARVFVGSTIDLFHNKTIDFLHETTGYVNQRPDVTFIFLTKCPQNLPRDWPDNCWVGVSVTANGDMTRAMTNLANVKASVRFLSFEPLLGMIGMSDHMSMKGIIQWAIIGQQTPAGAKTAPKIEWLQEIIEAADTAKIPVFLKNNLKPLFLRAAGRTCTPVICLDQSLSLRQEYPIKGE